MLTDKEFLNGGRFRKDERELQANTEKMTKWTVKTFEVWKAAQERAQEEKC